MKKKMWVLRAYSYNYYEFERFVAVSGDKQKLIEEAKRDREYNKREVLIDATDAEILQLQVDEMPHYRIEPAKVV